MTLQIANYSTPGGVASKIAWDFAEIVKDSPTIGPDGTLGVNRTYDPQSYKYLITQLIKCSSQITVSLVTQLPGPSAGDTRILYTEPEPAWGQILYNYTSPSDPAQFEISYMSRISSDEYFMVEVADSFDKPVVEEVERSSIILLHMLSHVFDVVSAGLFDSTVWELNAFDRENLYRLDKDNSLRLRVSVKVYYPSHIVTGNGCFVASAAYGSPLEPEVQSLRRFRETVLRPTRTGGAFFDRFYRHYDRLSRPIVAAMERDDEQRGLFRTALVTPIVRWLELATEFPDAPLDGVPEPWRSFLSDTRRNLEDWGQAIDLPDGFDGLSTEEAVAEIGMILRYVLRTDARRNAYLDRLSARGEIPFHCAGADYSSCVETLRALGRPAHEIARLLEQHQKEV